MFHHVFRALNQSYSLKRRMLAHDAAHPVHPYHELKEGRSAHRTNIRRGFKVPRGFAYLHGFVIPAVCPVLLTAATVQHQQRPGGVPGLQAAGLIQAHYTQAALHRSQRVPVGLIWIKEGRGGEKSLFICV